MKLQDIIREGMLPGDTEICCRACRNWTPRSDGSHAGYCRRKTNSLYSDDWCCIRFDSKD